MIYIISLNIYNRAQELLHGDGSMLEITTTNAGLFTCSDFVVPIINSCLARRLNQQFSGLQVNGNQQRRWMRQCQLLGHVTVAGAQMC